MNPANRSIGLVSIKLPISEEARDSLDSKEHTDFVGSPPSCTGEGARGGLNPSETSFALQDRGETEQLVVYKASSSMRRILT